MIATGKKSTFQEISGWVRGNLFIPDPRVFWVKPAVTFLHEFLKSNQVDKIITTGPPHSIHLIGLKLKKKNPGLKWVADFRDPWSQWDLFDTLSLTRFARKRHLALEKEVLQNADRAITIAPYHVNLFEKLGGRKVDLITNGFDTDDFAQVKRQRTDKFTIRHTGVVDELRDPRPFMLALKDACVLDPSLKENVIVEFIGNVNSAFKDFVQSEETLKAVTRFSSLVPHTELLQMYGKTDMLLLVLAHTAIAPGNLPGKLFEYLAAGVPVIGIGPVDGDAGQIIREANAGDVFDRNDRALIKDALLKEYTLWKSGATRKPSEAARFSREKLTEQLISILESL
jgi:glycosyltransferase involved in cell wall biosynthesis